MELSFHSTLIDPRLRSAVNYWLARQLAPVRRDVPRGSALTLKREINKACYIYAIKF